MCLAQNQDARNPIHIAVIKDRIEVLKELVRAKPEAAQVPVQGGGTILHLCVKHFHLEALRLLVENISTDHDIVNSKDDNGLTVLHLALAKNQHESIKILTTTLLTNGSALGRRNGSNNIDASPSSVQEVTTISPRSLSLDPNHQSLRSHSLVKTHRKHKHNIWLEKKRTTLMVVASLIAPMAYESGINPPKALLQESNKATFKKTPVFLSYKTTGFLASLTVILLLIGALPLRSKFIVWILTVIMWIAMAYTLGLCILLEPYGSDYPRIQLAVTTWFWYAVLAFLLLGHAIRLALKVARYTRESCRRTRHHLPV